MADEQPAAPRTVRGQIWPTLPRQSLDPQSWSVIKYYSATLAPGDPDYPALGIAVTRNVKFDLPVTLLAWNAAVIISDGSGFPVGWDPLNCFSVKLSTVGGENITIESRLGGSFMGVGRRNGFSMGGGWPFGPGSSLVCEITPRLAGLAGGVQLRVELTFPALQTRIGSSQDAQAIMGGIPGARAL